MTSTIGHIVDTLDTQKLGPFYSNKFEVIIWCEIYYQTHLFRHIQKECELMCHFNFNEMLNKKCNYHIFWHICRLHGTLIYKYYFWCGIKLLWTHDTITSMIQIPTYVKMSNIKNENFFINPYVMIHFDHFINVFSFLNMRLIFSLMNQNLKCV